MEPANAKKVSRREAVTIRFPVDLLDQAKQLKKGKESFNELVIEALEHEVRRRRALTAHQSIVARRAQIKARTGVQPEATALIRSLREGEERRD
jgi:predicted CopG family antitoxin